MPFLKEQNIAASCSVGKGLIFLCTRYKPLWLAYFFIIVHHIYKIHLPKNTINLKMIKFLKFLEILKIVYNPNKDEPKKKAKKTSSMTKSNRQVISHFF